MENGRITFSYADISSGTYAGGRSVTIRKYDSPSGGSIVFEILYLYYADGRLGSMTKSSNYVEGVATKTRITDYTYNSAGEITGVVVSTT